MSGYFCIAIDNYNKDLSLQTYATSLFNNYAKRTKNIKHLISKAFYRYK